MGYQTRYRLEWDNEAEEAAFAKWRKASQEFRWLFPLDDETEVPVTETEPTKWYEHMRDMQVLSASCPSVRFVLSGEGEESGDIWVAYFLGGQGYKQRARLVFDDYDATKLTNPPTDARRE